MQLPKATSTPLFLFLGLVTIFATLSYFVAFSGGEGNEQGGFLLLQFSPAFAAIITKLIHQRNLKGLGWTWGKSRYQLISLVLPFVIALIGFGLVWILGFGNLVSEPYIAEAQAGISAQFGINISSNFLLILMVIILNSTIGLLIGFAAIGEEIGWRGFLVPELFKQMSYTKTSIVSGIIWSAFHFPLLFVIIAPKLEVSVWPLLISTTISGIGLSFILAWLRLKSGSLWTAVIFHAALNIHVQGFFQNLTEKSSSLTNYISGEQGLMMALVTALVAYLFWRKRGEIK